MSTFAQERLAGFMHHTAARAAWAGEPWLTYFRPEEAWERYYINRQDGLTGPSLASIANAIV